MYTHPRQSAILVTVVENTQRPRSSGAFVRLGVFRQLAAKSFAFRILPLTAMKEVLCSHNRLHLTKSAALIARIPTQGEGGSSGSVPPPSPHPPAAACPPATAAGSPATSESRSAPCCTPAFPSAGCR